MARIVVYVERGGTVETFTVVGDAAEELLRRLMELEACGKARRGRLSMVPLF